jgi:putative membrane protein
MRIFGQRNTVRSLAVILAAGIGLDLACRFYPAQLPALAPWDFSWVEFLVAAFALWAYLRGLRATGAPLRPAFGRQLSFLAGVGLTYAVLQTRFDYAAQHMFTLTCLQHLVTHHLGPFLIVLGRPGALLWRGLTPEMHRALSRPGVRRALHLMQQPILAGVLFVALVFVWLVPAVLLRVMLDARLYALMNWLSVADGLVFWGLVFDYRPAPPARLSRGLQLLTVFAVQWPQIAGGAVIGFSGIDLYPYYTLCGRLLPAISAQTDQQIGAFLIWFGGGMMSSVAALLLLRALWAEEAAITFTDPVWAPAAATPDQNLPL